MAFLTVEDLVGSVEVIVFPRIYEKYRELLNEDQKVFIYGHAQVKEDANAQLIADQLLGFEEVPRNVWIQFENMADYNAKEENLREIIKDMDGRDGIVIYLKAEKQMKKLPPNYNILANRENLNALIHAYSEENVKVVEKNVEFSNKRY
jgi:DNA polymerase-3 subunit alpha